MARQPPRRRTLVLVAGGHALLAWALLGLTDKDHGTQVQATPATATVLVPVALHLPRPAVQQTVVRPAATPTPVQSEPAARVAPAAQAAETAVPPLTVPALSAAPPAAEPPVQPVAAAPAPSTGVPPPPAAPPTPPASPSPLPSPRDSPVQAVADHRLCAPAAHPAALRERGIEGAVLLRVKVDAQGRAADVQLLAGSGWRLFDEAALQQARGCRFFPARQGGHAIESWVEFPVRFALQG